MPKRIGATRAYGKKSTRTRAERMFAELPPTPERTPYTKAITDPVHAVAEQLSAIDIQDDKPSDASLQTQRRREREVIVVDSSEDEAAVEKLNTASEARQKAIVIPDDSKDEAFDDKNLLKTPKASIRHAAYDEAFIKCTISNTSHVQTSIRNTTEHKADVKSTILETPPASPTQQYATRIKNMQHPAEDETTIENTAPKTPPFSSTKQFASTIKGIDKKVQNLTEVQEHPELPGAITLRVLAWDDVCPAGDQITKIAEASYAEVYRVSNARGVSIMKAIRLDSPIKPQTKAQVRAGLVDEEPHSEADVSGELQISEWLADIPGFVVYKERYIVQGNATKHLLETHQLFQKKMKKEDPGRAQFYPSPSRYLKDTKFLVIELGDAGKALEDWELSSESQLWDIFFQEAIALGRAEDLALFEHRDLHEGNLCIKQVTRPVKRNAKKGGFFGFSGIELTILDYGISRAEDTSVDSSKPIAFDLEKDLSLFTSTHAPQCKVYRQMRSFFLTADRKCLPPEEHNTPYAEGVEGPLDWGAYAPYTNVLWLAYLYSYLVNNFAGEEKELKCFKKETKEMWKYLNPESGADVCFGSAEDIVGFAVEAGWVLEEQLMEYDGSVRGEGSIIMSRDERRNSQLGE